MKVSDDSLRRVLALAVSYVEDVESGIAEGLYVAADNDVAGDRAAIEEIERAVEANAVLQTAPLVLLEVKGGCVTEHAQGDVEFAYFDHDNVRTYGEPPVLDPEFKDLVTQAFGDPNFKGITYEDPDA
jgi:hypothetical protein